MRGGWQREGSLLSPPHNTRIHKHYSFYLTLFLRFCCTATPPSSHVTHHFLMTMLLESPKRNSMFYASLFMIPSLTVELETRTLCSHCSLPSMVTCELKWVSNKCLVLSFKHAWRSNQPLFTARYMCLIRGKQCLLI